MNKRSRPPNKRQAPDLSNASNLTPDKTRRSRAQRNRYVILAPRAISSTDDPSPLRKWDLLDPLLTPQGFEQCLALQTHLQAHCLLATQVEGIISSPMRRTCQTAQTALKWLIEKGVPVKLDAKWQENSTNPCDSGSDLKDLPPQFPDLDFSAVDPIYPSKAPDTLYAWNAAANKARGEACLKDLYNRSEKVVAVVSHAGFLRTGITGGRRFANADYRIFRFKKGGKGIIEEQDTKKRGGGMGRSEKGVHKVQEWDFPEEDEDDDDDDE